MGSSNCSNQSVVDNVISITEIHRFRRFLTYKYWQKIHEIAKHYKELGYNPGEFFEGSEDI